ncbi:transcriptional regulator [Klebsiella michiganensis]|uniref:Transcriptional regulator n=1 Tax=Klebsiella michiganensis TaxID=1134687 RepID=A0A7H4PPF1_9ENTR|nr:transcriptional regulator [Klebsiella michiganensis]
MNKFVEMSTFVSVVESLSFVGAAAKLGTSKSVVSQRVKMLEKRLGASLLERGPRLSPHGGGPAILSGVRAAA